MNLLNHFRVLFFLWISSPHFSLCFYSPASFLHVSVILFTVIARHPKYRLVGRYTLQKSEVCFLLCFYNIPAHRYQTQVDTKACHAFLCPSRNINTDSFIGVEQEPQRLRISLVLPELPAIMAALLADHTRAPCTTHTDTVVRAWLELQKDAFCWKGIIRRNHGPTSVSTSEWFVARQMM